MRFPYNIIYFFRYEIKYFFQRIFRGYDDRAIWDLDYYIATKVIKPLKHFRACVCGTPISFTETEWHAVLDKMIYSMEFIIEDNYLITSAADNSRIDEGLFLFGKHFRSLWY